MPLSGCLGCDLHKPIWEFPKIRGTLLGVPILRIIVFWGLYWGPLILGNYHLLLEEVGGGLLAWICFTGA